MDDKLQHQSIQYDLHRLVVLMIFIGASIAATGVYLSVWFEYQNIGIDVLNHRADFLGDYTKTPYAFIYNMSLMVAGLCTLLSMTGLYLLRLSSFSRYLSLSGSVVGLSIVLMGMFPINYLEVHRLISTCYLIGTVVMFFLCISDKFSHNSVCSWPVFFLSVLGFIAASGLVLQLNWHTLDYTPCINHTIKQHYCWVAITMWTLTNIIMLWCLAFAWSIRNIAIKNYLELSQRYLAGEY
ncbi:conserved hypothetical protein [Shewanella halifaxensis HAW-EB4]|uniref:DUF998 domain-containing protein n=1 Tax=Shewanella halifaxensis (strain HAW-EB4) TaxID=458817 RepID=B0TTG6_SHEHH|nr:DUF998 domain-containing protein [Shewanella halifaxensis]ABZ75309.1 conserved hypothetical protein [Shewanella halifaxensis HAW-EB4]